MKKITAIVVFVLASLILVACGHNDDNGDGGDGRAVSISYWNPITGADGTIMRQMVKDFNEAYKDQIIVIDQASNEPNHYDNLNLNIPIGRGPDVAIMHDQHVQGYANRGLLTPLDSLVTSSDITLGDFPSQLIDSLYFQEKLFAIPLDMHPLGIYYNKDILNSLGVDVPTNRTELLHAASLVSNTNEGVWGLPLSTEWPSDYTFLTALFQNGGVELSAIDEPGFNTPEGEAALKSLTDIIHEANLSPLNYANDQDLFAFRNGKALFHIQGTWMLNSLKESNINFGIIPLSKMFNESSDTIGVKSHTFVMPIQRNANASKQNAVMTFIKYMTDNGAKWATAGQIPASSVARSSDEYLDIEHLSDFGLVENFRIGTPSPYYFEGFTPIFSRLTYALQNRTYNAKELLTSAETEAKGLIKEVKESLE